MDFDKKIEFDNLLIYCSDGLFEFSNEFIQHFNANIDNIRRILGIANNKKLIIALTDDENLAGYIYGKSSFSGFFNDTGCFAYINLFGDKNKEYMFRGIMHELIHHLYKYYVYGKDKQRITWVDEGLAQLLSGQKQELENNDNYMLFLRENLKNKDNSIDLNKLNHEDRSFGNNNGYNLSYIAIRHIYENSKLSDFIEIINDSDKLIKIGSSIVQEVNDFYFESEKQKTEKKCTISI